MTIIGEFALWISLPIAAWGMVLGYAGGRTLRAHKSATRGAGKRLQNGHPNGPTAATRRCQSKTVVPMIGLGTSTLPLLSTICRGGAD